MGVHKLAGQKLTRAITAHVVEMGGADWLYEQMASGMTVVALAKKFDCARGTMSRILNSRPEWVDAMVKARTEAADAYAEQGLEIVDALDKESSPSAIAAAREQSQYRRFLAGAFNTDRYGTRAGVSVNINIGDLHLEALKKRRTIDMTSVDDAEVANGGE